MQLPREAMPGAAYHWRVGVQAWLGRLSGCIVLRAGRSQVEACERQLVDISLSHPLSLTPVTTCPRGRMKRKQSWGTVDVKRRSCISVSPLRAGAHTWVPTRLV